MNTRFPSVCGRPVLDKPNTSSYRFLVKALAAFPPPRTLHLNTPPIPALLGDPPLVVLRFLVPNCNRGPCIKTGQQMLDRVAFGE